MGAQHQDTPGTQKALAERITVVIATRNRCAELGRTLDELRRNYPDVPVIVVDNASGDGTAATLRRAHPDVRIVPLDTNAGAAARNTGVRLAQTPYVAFSDDDSWWEAGALVTAVDLLEQYPWLGLIAARTLVGDRGVADPVNALMERSPLGASDPPGVPVLGFTACSAVVRRRAFLDVGGFSELLFFVGEERLLAQDLAAGGWALRYVEGVGARHHPSPNRPPPRWRRVLEWRNTVLTAWLRRPAGTAIRETLRLLASAVWDPAARRAVPPALARLPAALRARRLLPAPVEADLRLLEREARALAGAAREAGGR